jgi:hypothetical protein
VSLCESSSRLTADRKCSEEDLTDSLEAAMEKYPDTYAVLVRRHGV